MLVERNWQFLHQSWAVFITRQHVPHVVQVVLSRLVLISVSPYAEAERTEYTNEINGTAKPGESLHEQHKSVTLHPCNRETVEQADSKPLRL